MWLPLAVLATLAGVMVYSADQQVLRQSANDPQRAMAIDAAARLDGGAMPVTVAGPTKVEMSASLLPFVIVLDGNGNVLASDATLNGAAIQPPSGLVAEARSTGRDEITWQPAPGVRSATVTVPWKGGAVLAGRSLIPTEERADVLLIDLFLGGLFTLGCLAVACLVAARVWPAG